MFLRFRILETPPLVTDDAPPDAGSDVGLIGPYRLRRRITGAHQSETVRVVRGITNEKGSSCNERA